MVPDGIEKRFDLLRRLALGETRPGQNRWTRCGVGVSRRSSLCCHAECACECHQDTRLQKPTPSSPSCASRQHLEWPLSLQSSPSPTRWSLGSVFDVRLNSECSARATCQSWRQCLPDLLKEESRGRMPVGRGNAPASISWRLLWLVLRNKA